MARNLKYKMTILTRPGIPDFCVGIYQDGWNGQAITLTPATDPLTIEEDEPDDMFQPVVLSSGYIRYVATGGIGMITASAPTDLYVVVCYGQNITASSTPIWTGYVKPEVLSDTVWGNNEDCELPIVSSLSVLDSFDPYQTDGFDNIGKMLLDTIKQPGNAFSSYHFYFPKTTRYFSSILELQLPWQNWWDLKSDNEDNNSQSPYNARVSALGLLEEICKFGNWQLRQDGDNLYFMTPEKSQAYWLAIEQDMNDVSSAQPSDYTPYEVDDIWAEYISTDQHDEYVPGAKSVEVKSDVHMQNSVMLEIDWKKLEFKEYSAITDRDGHSFRIVRFEEFQETGNDRMNYGTLTRPTACYYYLQRSMASTGFYSPLIMGYDTWVTSEQIDKHSYDWKKYLFVQYLHDLHCPTDHVVYHIETKTPYRFERGTCALDISGLCKYTDINNWGIIEDCTGDEVLHCRLRIGDLYWNGYSWVTDPAGTTEFLINVKDGVISNNQRLVEDADIEKGSGWIVRITGNAGQVFQGKVVFEVIANDFCNVYADLKVGYLGPARNEWLNIESTYSAKKAISKYGTKKSRSFRVCNKHNGIVGLGVVTNANGQYMETVQWANNLQQASENYMLNRMYSFYNTSRWKECYEVNIVRAFTQSDTEIYNPTVVYLSGGDLLSYITARSFNFGEGTVKLKAIQI